MRAAPFRARDLDALERLLRLADAVYPMEDIFDGAWGNIIGMRHDCDNVIVPAVHLAEWEVERDFVSTYYILHSAPYWNDKRLLRSSLERIAECGHEIGIHNDALTVALQTGMAPEYVLYEAVTELRSYGFNVRSTVAHGHHLCRVVNYVNDEMFVGCERPNYGDPERILQYKDVRVKIKQVELSQFGLDFDANWLPRGDYLSDSGGHWSQPFEDVAAAWPNRGQLHILQHPDWWAEAFEQVAA